MLPLEEVSFIDLAAWRAWLEDNHDSNSGIWMIFSKKHTGQACIDYEDAIGEALCWGWIDSIIRRIDDDTYARKFTPRRPGSIWSELNRWRVARLVREGRMREPGLALVDFPVGDSADPRPRRAETDARLPAYVLAALEKNPQAQASFEKLPPSHRRNYIGWVDSAKREETRQRRLAEMLERLEHGQSLGLK